MAGRFSVEAVFKGVDQITAPLSKMQNSVGNFTRRSSVFMTRFSSEIDAMNSKFKQTALEILGLGLALGYAGKQIIDVGAEFEKEIVRAATRLDVPALRGSEAFEALENAAIEAGKTTEFSLIESAKAFNILAGAGYNAQQAILGLPKLMDMATVAGEGLEETSSMVNDLMSSFQISKDIEGFSRATDVLSKTANKSNAVLTDLFETMKQAGALSVRAKVSFESIASMAGIMADAGIKGSAAGTSIKNFMFNLSSPASKKSEKLMNKLGLNFKNAKGELKDMPDIIDHLNDKLGKLSSTGQTDALKVLFGKYGLAGMTALLNKGGDAFRKYREDIENAKGTTASLAKIMRDILAQDMDNLASAFEALEVKITKYANKSLRNAIQKTTDWINKNDELIAQKLGAIISKIADNLDEIVEAMGWIALTIGTWIAFRVAIFGVTIALGVLAGLANVITFLVILKDLFMILITRSFLLSAGLWVLNVAMGAFNVVVGILAGIIGLLLSPIVLITLAIIALGLAIYYIIQYWDDIKEFFSNFDTYIQGTIDWVKDLTSSIGDLISQFGSWLGLSSKGDFKVSAFGLKEESINAMIGEKNNDNRPQIISPQDKVVKSLSENNTTQTNKAEITIKDETGRAKVTKGEMGDGLKMQSSGGF